MEIIILDTAEEIAVECASIYEEIICKNKSAVLGLATGSTPTLLYKELVARYVEKRISFSEVITFNLDEYVGLKPNHTQSYHYFMQKHLFNHIDIKEENTYLPSATIENILKISDKYEKKIEFFGGIDLQLLGIGTNGHIGFNEPTSSLGSRTRVKTLTEQTIKDNSRFFAKGEFQPELAITMGIGTIMQSKKIVLLATGQSKALAIQQAVEGPISAMNPASALQMHANTTFIIDNNAASLLKMRDYYLWVYKQSQTLQNKRNSKK